MNLDINSLAYFKADGTPVTAFCQSLACRHSARLDVDSLIRAFGPEFCIAGAHDRFIRALRCNKCGGREISIIIGIPKDSVAPAMSVATA